MQDASTNLPGIVFLTQVFPRYLDDPLGAFLWHLARALTAQGLTVEVIAPHGPGLAVYNQLDGVRVHRFRYAPARWERLAYTGVMHQIVARGIANKFLFACLLTALTLKAMAIVARGGSRVIHAHWWLPAGLAGALASLAMGKPLVITTHGTDVELLPQTPWAMPLARFVFSRARAITCGSTYLRQQLLSLGVADAGRLHVIPMPVSPLFEGEPPAAIRSQDEILTVARLTEQKGIDTLIRAMAVLRDRGCRARLKIIGDGPERASLEKEAQALGLGDCVAFLGMLAQRELPQHYASCAVFVLPSLREGTGLVLVEALLCGAPVIATDYGGVTDIVRDQETGLLVPAGDSIALAEAIQRLLEDRLLAQRLAANGRAWVLPRFAGQQVAARFREIYLGL